MRMLCCGQHDIYRIVNRQNFSQHSEHRSAQPTSAEQRPESPTNREARLTNRTGGAFRKVGKGLVPCGVRERVPLQYASTASFMLAALVQVIARKQDPAQNQRGMAELLNPLAPRKATLPRKCLHVSRRSVGVEQCHRCLSSARSEWPMSPLTFSSMKWHVLPIGMS
jgi:hypothetical protein